MALAVFDDGSGHGEELYAGGQKWDGTTWRPCGTFVDGIALAMLAFDDGSGPGLIAGGQFAMADGQPAANLARWNGTSWSELGGGLNGRVNALAVFDDGSGPALYVGGGFNLAGGNVPVSGVARWNGASWSAVGPTGTLPVISVLATFDDESGSGPALYAGGLFTSIGGVPANNIARWDGTSWSALGSGTAGVTPSVLTLTGFDDGLGGGPALYAGGAFTSAGGVSTKYVARWDGTGWSALGAGMDKLVNSLTVHEVGGAPTLVAGGRFSFAGGAMTRRVARWNGTSWSALPGPELFPTCEQVKALTVYDDGSGAPRLFAIPLAPQNVSGFASRWADGWGPLETTALVAGVLCMTAFDDGDGSALYVGGVVNDASDALIHKWNGEQWSGLGSGHVGQAAALASFDDGTGSALYATGDFTSAGGTPAAHIAKWDGASWSPLGSGLGAPGSALQVFDDGTGFGEALYVGGTFPSAGGSTMPMVARWNGTAWFPVGSGLAGSGVTCFAVFDDGAGPALYAGGGIRPVGSPPSPIGLVKWNGATWQVVGNGLAGFGTPTDLRVFDDGSGPALYASGFFSGAGGIPVDGFARWDGTSWSEVVGAPGEIEALEVFDDGSGPALYFAGAFDTAGGMPASRIARWDGTSWSPLGRGMVGWSLTSLAVFDDGVSPGLHAGWPYGAAVLSGLQSYSVDSGDSGLAVWRACVDRTPPLLFCPSTVNGLLPAGASGRFVSFVVGASDEVDPAPTVVCVPPSGSFFPAGTTLVNCTATDASGNQATCQFPVRVEPKLGPRAR